MNGLGDDYNEMTSQLTRNLERENLYRMFVGLPVIEKTPETMKSLPNIAVDVLDLDIRGLLTRLFIQTKIRRWAIISEDEIDQIFRSAKTYRLSMTKSSFDIDERLLVPRIVNIDHYAREHCTWQAIKQSAMSQLNAHFPFVQEMLIHFGGRIIAAGGAVFKSLHGIGMNNSDLDLFFTDPNVESDEVCDLDKSIKATKLLKEAVSYLTYRWMNHASNDGAAKGNYVTISRNQFVTTVNFCHMYGRKAKIQFIHRVYPSVGSVLGGFDLTPCMVGWDGQRILAIEIGAWSALGALLIVDISRRSTSFEHRLQKYSKWCHVIFPGLSCGVKPEHISRWISSDNAVHMIHRIMREKGFELLRNNKRGIHFLSRRETDSVKMKRDALLTRFHELAELEGFKLDDFNDKNIVPIYGDQEEEELEMIKYLKSELFRVGWFFDMDRVLSTISNMPRNNSDLLLSESLRPMDTILKLPRLDVKTHKHQRVYFAVNKQWSLRVPKSSDIRYRLNITAESDYHGRMVVEESPGIKKISDYEDSSLDCWFAVLVNASLLIHGKLDGITSNVVIIRKGESLEDLTFNNEEHHQAALLGIRSSVVELDFSANRDIVEKRVLDIVSKSFDTVNIGDMDDVLEDYVNRIRNPNENDNTTKLRNFLFPYDDPAEEMDVLLDHLDGKMASDTLIVYEKLETVKWILNNPGRQWTSSINPIVADPRDWYGHYYESYRIGNINVETCLKLFRLRGDNYFALMPKDLFGYLMGFVMWASSYHLAVELV